MNNRTITDDYTAKSWKAGDKLLASDLTKMSAALDAVENELVDVTNTTIPGITSRLDTAEATIGSLQTSAGAVDVPQGQTVTQYVDQKVADLVGTAPETLDTIAEVAAAIETNGDAIEAIQSLVTENGTAIDGVQTTVEDLGARTETLEQTAVKFTEFQRDQDETVRKTIQLDNFDSISGITTTGAGVNLAMVSKWDKADFGSAQIPLNLNSKDGVVTINDGAQVATVGDLPDLSGYAKVEEINAKLDEKADKSELPDLTPYATTASVDEKLAEKQPVGDYPVYQKFVAGADPAERKTIQLANADSISGVASTGGGANLIMMSKWDKVDIGSVNYQMNLNSPSGVVQINDEKVVATTDQIPDVSVFASKTELNEAIEAVQANIPDHSQFVTNDVYNEDKAGLQTAIDSKAAAEHTHTVDHVVNLQTILDGKQPVGDYPVYKQFVAGASDKQRKTIQLANADSISGIMSTGTGVNLAMVSEWDKADFGSSQLPLNLNATDGIVTINDTKTVATVDQIPDVSEFATTSYVDNKVASVMKYAGSVKTVGDLPDSDLTIGDVYNVEEDGSNYAWDGSQWDKLGGTIDLSSYATVESVQTGLESKADVVHMHNIADINGLQDTLNGKQPVGDYALNSALEPLATKEAVAGLKVVDLGTFDKIEGASYAAGADGVYNNKEAVVLTFDTAEGSGVIFNTMTATNSAAQRMYWNNQVLSRTVTDGSGTGWGVLSNFTELQNRAIKSTLFTMTTDADSETIKAAMTNENSKTITASDLDSCLKYGYTIRDYALQSGSIFVGWTGSAYTLTYIGFASPTSEPYVMSVVVNVTPEGEYSIVRNGTRGQILTSSNLASNKTFAAVADVAPVIVNINLRDSKLTTEVQEKETILGWFGVTTDVELKQLIAGTRPMFVRYGISLSTNPHYYKMPIEYIAYESATQLKLVFSGLDTSNDQPVRYTIVANLDGTPIEEGGNVSIVLEPIDTQADIDQLATKQELSEGLAGKAAVVHTHAISDVTGLQDALDGKQDKGDYATNEVVQAEFESYDKTIKAYVEQQVMSKADQVEVDSLDSRVDVVESVSGNIYTMQSQIAQLIEQVQHLKTPTVEPVEISAEQPSVDHADQDVSFNATVSGTVGTITAKSIQSTNASIQSGRLAATATNDVSIKNLSTSGDLAKSTANAGLSVNTDQYVTITGADWQQTGYNGIEVGLSSAPKSVLIDGVDFKATMSNNAISIFSWQENAVITISNCHFANVSNPLRLSNRDNKPCTINIVNCTCDQWTAGEYAGFICMQDYTSSSAHAAQEANQFGKLTINFVNCSGPDGRIVGNAQQLAENHIIYVYTNQEGLIAFGDGSRYPTVTAQ